MRFTAPLALGLLAAASPAALAQPFEKTYSSSGSNRINDEQFRAVQQFYHRLSATLFNASAFAAGNTPSGTGFLTPPDWLTSTIQPSGTLTWDERQQALDGGFVGATSVGILSNGDAVVAGLRGNSLSFQPDGAGLARVSPTGAVVWTVPLLGSGDGFRFLPTVAVLPGDEIALIALNADRNRVIYHRISSAGAVLNSTLLSTNNPAQFLSLADLQYDPGTGTLVAAGEIFDTFGDFDSRTVLARLSLSGTPINAITVDELPPPDTDITSVPSWGTGVEVLDNGDVALLRNTTLFQPEPSGGGFIASSNTVAVGRFTPAFTQVWHTAIYGPFFSGDNIQAHRCGIRQDRDGIIGVLGQFSFGDGGSTLWLARFTSAGLYLSRHLYGSQGNSFPGGFTPAMDAPGGWIIAGFLQNFQIGGPMLIRARPDGTTGCEQLVFDEPVSLQPEIAPVTLVASAVTLPLPWPTAQVSITLSETTVCSPGSIACNRADVTDIGDTGAGPDGQLTVDDIIAFVNTFSDGIGCPGASPCNLADITDIGDTGSGPDGQLTVDDIIAFFNAFSDGCP